MHIYGQLWRYSKQLLRGLIMELCSTEDNQNTSTEDNQNTRKGIERENEKKK